MAVNELRVPVGRIIELELTAPVHDVIHSWWVPRLAGKIDAIPGKVNTLWFEAEAPGLYEGQCAEFCGAQHSCTRASAPCLRRSTTAGSAGRPLAWASRRGRACAPCHGDEGQGLIGPPLAGRRLNPEQVRTIVTNGRGAMPAVGTGWDERQLRALIAYVTLRNRGKAGRWRLGPRPIPSTPLGCEAASPVG